MTSSAINMHPYSNPASDSASSSQKSTASRTFLGRSGPRSRNGCVTCKQRRVRCDEIHPVCGHCARLQLNCCYQSWKRGNRSRPRNDVGDNNSTNLDFLTLPTSAGFAVQGDRTPIASSRSPNHIISGYATPTWGQSRRFDFNAFNELDTSWAGEFSCLFPDIGSPQAVPSFAVTAEGSADAQNALVTNDFSTSSSGHRPLEATITADQASRDRLSNSEQSSQYHATGLANLATADVTGQKMDFFRRIVQPPAAILIGGFERWRRLQRYLCRMSQQSTAVQSALFCVIGLLMLEQNSHSPGSANPEFLQDIFHLHTAACEDIKLRVTRHGETRSKVKEAMLAAIFLLAWFEVIRDQDEQSSLFPRDLADLVINDAGPWNRYSKQLLSWLNTLDSKATHLGGHHLLTPKTLAVVAHFPTQITSSVEDTQADSAKNEEDPEFSGSELSPGSSHYSPDNADSQSSSLRLGQVKHVMLNTILQPALEWYLSSQGYCRRISAHDKHHRGRFTSDDEYEVVVACKQIEAELFELWDSRPSVMSLTTEQLEKVMSADLATRLEEIFSVYLASFWILFVYLHRVSWWHLPHSALAKRALDEVWKHMQRAYGEEVNGPLHKVIHPSLLWPLFLYGSECPDTLRRIWAIEQLEALGEAKPILQNESAGPETLPPFRLSAGATRNAKRAASLLRELTKEQDKAQSRVDDRDLSMKLFGCYFSIV